VKPLTIVYRTLMNTGNYENRTIGIEALIDEDETPEAALAAAKAWVETQHAVAAKDADALMRAEGASKYVGLLKTRIISAQQAAQSALTALGGTPSDDTDEMPF
jgi:hypothetical protein